MEVPCSKPTCHGSHPPFFSSLLDKTKEDLERIQEKIDEDIDIKPFVKIDEETIQHLSHDHQLILHGNENSCDPHDVYKYCQACCLQLTTSERFYGCIMQCDFTLHETCASLPREKKSPLHKHPLTLQTFPPEPKFEDYVKGMSACDGCEQLNCGFMYKCHEKGCEFQLDTRCASLSNPLIHENFHDHQLFFSKTRGTCRSCKSSKCSRYLLKCKICNFVLGLKCATLPRVAHYRHDKRPLTLCYGRENTRNLQYCCEKCESEIDCKTWFYTCDDSCEFSLHVKCLLGKDIYMKPQHIIRINDEEVEIVRNECSTHQAYCYVCGRCCVHALIFKWLDRYSCTFLCIVTFFL